MSTSIAYYRTLARKHPPLPACAETALMRRIAAASTQKERAPAVEELVRHNLGRVVAFVSRRYDNRPNLVDDAVSVAVGALFSAANRADDTHSQSFWGFAEKRVRGELIEFDRRQPLIPVTRYGLERTRGLHAHREARSDYNPAAVAIVTLAVGLGSVTAMYSVLRALVVRPFNSPEAERIVHVGSGDRRPLSAHEFVDLHGQMSAFETFGVYSPGPFNIGGDHPLKPMAR